MDPGTIPAWHKSSLYTNYADMLVTGKLYVVGPNIQISYLTARDGFKERIDNSSMSLPFGSWPVLRQGSIVLYLGDERLPKHGRRIFSFLKQDGTVIFMVDDLYLPNNALTELKTRQRHV